MPAALAGLVLLACGSSPTGGGAPTTSSSSQSAPSSTPPATSTATPPGAVDACSLATQSEVDAAAGVSLGAAAPQPPPSPGATKCSWPGHGPPVGGLIEPGITLAVVPLGAGVSASNLPMFSGRVPNATHIAGVGDAAVTLSPGQLGPASVQVFVAAHGSILTLSLVYSGSARSPDPVQTMTTLARAVVGRYR